ncbi:hypothetical protein, partial [Phocaeicola plebeius]|uniref:hypothetical protein n=1 Tax=Phocaeicola plebeius TaxID=310297 RepID=UPI0026EB7AF6
EGMGKNHASQYANFGSLPTYVCFSFLDWTKKPYEYIATQQNRYNKIVIFIHVPILIFFFAV